MKRTPLLKIKALVSNIWPKGVCWMIVCALSDPSLVEAESHNY